MTVDQKIVLIVSDDSDASSEIISKYLEYRKVLFHMITPSSCESYNEILEFLNLSDSVLLRRGNFPSKKYTSIPELESETKVLNDYLHFTFEKNTNSIGNLRSEYNHNKLIDLWIAKRCGLIIPKTTIVTSRKELIDFFAKNDNTNYITKSLKNPLKVKSTNSICYYGYTLDVSLSQVPKEITTFYPSLLQEKIEKTIEIRSFFIKGEIHSMAIFSQSNEKTSLDYRNYDHENPNRCVPYKLPKEIESSIREFMSDIDLNCGSLDIMLGTDGKYYFLEVNPVGQFGWLSYNCNYYLEEKIAQLLTQH